MPSVAAFRDCKNALAHDVIARRAIEELNEGVIDLAVGRQIGMNFPEVHLVTIVAGQSSVWYE